MCQIKVMSPSSNEMGDAFGI